MKSAIFAALALLSGCGGFYAGPSTGGHQYPYDGPGPIVRTSPDAFLIDAFNGTVADPVTFAITTDGNVWRLAWLGDAFAHKFQGAISCPAGCQFTYARFTNPRAGDYVDVVGNYATFDAVTNAAVPQVLDLQAPLQPLTYELYIDGQPAIGSVVFQSQGIRSTTDVMPFALYSNNAGFKAGEKPNLAPQFISQLPKDSVGQTFTLPAPEPKSTAASTAGETAAK